jgi:hypothetical protein
MKRLLVFLFIIFLAPFISGLYGIIHDQVTYTICPEYYTKFKFYQFGLIDLGDEALFPNPRIRVSQVGFLATWWMGLPIGIILGLVGLTIKDNKEMFKTTLKAFLITIIIAFFTGLIGLIIGKLYLADVGVSWRLPNNLVDKAGFIAVGSMHNFSYLGGLTGLIAGIIYILRRRKKLISSKEVHHGG